MKKVILIATIALLVGTGVGVGMITPLSLSNIAWAATNP